MIAITAVTKANARSSAASEIAGDGDSARKAAGSGGDLEQHAEPQVDRAAGPAVPAETALDVAITVIRLIAAALLNRQAEADVEKGHQEHAAADAEQRAEAAGNGTGGHDDQKCNGGDHVEPGTNAVSGGWCYDSARDATEFYLMFQRFFDEGLAQASFLIACDRTREAVGHRSASRRRRIRRGRASRRLDDRLRDRDPHPRRLRLGRARAARRSARASSPVPDRRCAIPTTQLMTANG